EVFGDCLMRTAVLGQQDDLGAVPQATGRGRPKSCLENATFFRRHVNAYQWSTPTHDHGNPETDIRHGGAKPSPGCFSLIGGPVPDGRSPALRRRPFLYLGDQREGRNATPLRPTTFSQVSEYAPTLLTAGGYDSEDILDETASGLAI